MYEGGVDSSPVRPNPNCWSMHPPSQHHFPHSLYAAAHPPELPESWSQLLLLEDKNWDEEEEEKWSCRAEQAGSLSNHMLCFPSNKNPSSQWKSSSGGAAKRAKIQEFAPKVSSLKVRKEKLGDRITALHHLVSPFGKTDTASVLLEAFGYIKFLENQVGALTLPYLNPPHSPNYNRKQPLPAGKRNRLLTHHSPSQEFCESNLLRSPEEYCDEEAKKDLRSRGLCLVPLSCTLEVGNDNGPHYWAPAFAPNFP